MKTVIEMAREAGFSLYRDISAADGSFANLERFAELVRAEAIAEEREACAKVADDWSKRRDDVGGYISRNIRARPNTLAPTDQVNPQHIQTPNRPLRRFFHSGEPMTLTPNPITATLPACVAMLRPWAAPVALRSVTPSITVLQRVNTLLTPTTLLAAVEGSSALDTVEIDRVIKPLQRSVDALRTRTATFDDWLRVASVINIARAIERQGVVRGLAAELDRCRAEAQAIGDRTGDDDATWQSPTLYATEIAALQDLVRWHKFQMQQLSYSEYSKARDYAVAKVRSSGGQGFNVR